MRKQRQNELFGKFNIPGVIVDGPEYKTSRKDALNPFDRNNLVVIVSVPFAFSKRDEIKEVGKWDLVVIDETHRLRNIYKKGNKKALGLRELFHGQPKALLTAAPLQNANRCFSNVLARFRVKIGNFVWYFIYLSSFDFTYCML